MTCRETERELVAYHFSLAPDDARRRVESHLVACPACVRAFVELKRAIETSADVPAPSRPARARLRRAVADELGLTERRWLWWERPLAVAVAASAVLVAGAATRALTSAPGAPPHALSVPRR
jgi:anti-sigma factor RsiW